MEAVLKCLDKASIDGDINELKELLKEDPLLLDTVLTMERNNPLHIAALLGHAEFTSEVLLLKQELASRLNREGMTPLHLAAARGHLQVAQILVDKVGNTICLIRDSKEGHFAAHIATVNGKQDVVKMLIKRCRELMEKTTTRMETLIHLAVKANNLDIIQSLIEEGVNLNQQDYDGNTCLHLAVARGNRQVITCLLDHAGKLEVNCTNAMGLTPLDVLLVTSLDSAVDISLVNTLRMAGGVGSRELGDVESNTSNSLPVGSTLCRRRPSTETENKEAERMQGEAQTLLIVATLVASMTFQAISNPPGGFVQIPFDKDDAQNNSTIWFHNWRTHTFPAGKPVLFWQLKTFFLLESVALYSSVSVILWLLISVPKTRVAMKILVAIVWFAAFCTALAFGSAFAAISVPDWKIGVGDDNLEYLLGTTDWSLSLQTAWFFFSVIAGFWASIRVIGFFWWKCEFKIRRPNWIAEVRWPKESMLVKRIFYLVLIVCVIAVFFLATYGIFLLIEYVTRVGVRAGYPTLG